MATMNRRLIQIIAIASLTSLVAASWFEMNGLTTFVNDTPWLSDLLNLTPDGMYKHNENALFRCSTVQLSSALLATLCIFVDLFFSHFQYVSHYSVRMQCFFQNN